jgi:hypothetical protein
MALMNSLATIWSISREKEGEKRRKKGGQEEGVARKMEEEGGTREEEGGVEGRALVL